jgi:hypothetical protein
MKKFLLIAISVVASQVLSAQALPAPSPKAKVFQTVGLTDIEVEYSSPAVNNRNIWGDVVPYNTMWRTGANRATKITFSTDAAFGGAEVKAGSYALFTTPTERSITVFLNSNWDQGGTGSYDPTLDVAKIEVRFSDAPVMAERMRFTIEDVTDYSANLVMTWGKKTFTVPIKVETDKFAEESIETKIKEINNLHGFYEDAADYYMRAGKDPKKVLEWAQKSVSINERFWNTYTLAKAYQLNGDKKMALQTAQRSLVLSQEAKYDEYVKRNQELIKALGGK